MTENAGPASFGRVEDDGTVYVRTAAGERSVGQIPDAGPDEALAFFVHRFEALQVEVDLLEQRLASGALSPDDARRRIAGVRSSVETANAVGDLDGLLARLDALAPVLAQAAEARKAERKQQQDAAREAKEAMVGEAEKLAAGNDWRGGVNRFRALLEEWKALPRIDRATDDALWHRFSTARTAYTRRRKAQFAEQAAKRDEAKVAKEKIIAEAEQYAGSDDWDATAGAFRDLMTRWKAAGAAPRDVDDKLWARFRGIQDEFFARRHSAQSEQDAEFKANQDAKEALLTEAEATVLPVKDVAASRAAFRSFLARYNEHGKVPRDAIRPLEGRVRAMEQAIRDAEEKEWKRTDPEAAKRASDTATMLAAQIDKLEADAAKAEARGDTTSAAKTRESIATYQSWLDQAQKALDDFTA